MANFSVVRCGRGVICEAFVITWLDPEGLAAADPEPAAEAEALLTAEVEGPVLAGADPADAGADVPDALLETDALGFALAAEAEAAELAGALTEAGPAELGAGADDVGAADEPHAARAIAASRLPASRVCFMKTVPFLFARHMVAQNRLAAQSRSVGRRPMRGRCASACSAGQLSGRCKLPRRT